MIFYVAMLGVVILGYYTLSYGIYLWQKPKEKLAGFGTLLIGLIATIFPLLLLFARL